MDWRIDGISDESRRAAEAAARRAGIPLSEWIVRALGNAPSQDAADIEKALKALEDQFAHAEATRARLIRPLETHVTRLADEARRAARPAVPEDLLQGDWLNYSPEAEPAPAEEPPELPRGRHKGRRIFAGLAALLLLGGGWWLWDWLHDRLDEPPPPAHAELPGLTEAGPDRTPPPGASLELQPLAPLPDPTPPQAAEMAPDALAMPTNDREAAALRTRAEAGDTAAEYTLGLALLRGEGVGRDPRAGGEWLSSAAVAGHPQAQYELSRLYAAGLGFPVDAEQAFFWTQSAAEQGVVEAAYVLGRMYDTGDGVVRNHTLAARWYRKAAEDGHAGALFELGNIYENGLDVRVNHDTALDFYRRAQAAGSSEATARIAALGGGQPAAQAPATAEQAPQTPPAAAPQAADTRLAREEIAEIQALLTQLAFDPGPADGTLGGRTRDAIMQYQEIAGLPADGIPSRRLLEQLRAVVGQTESNRAN